MNTNMHMYAASRPAGAPATPTPLAMSKHTELQYLKDQISKLEETITTQSLKMLVVCGLELYLSQALVLSLFECVNANKRDAQELKYMARMAWIPLLWGIVLAFGHRIAPSIAPAPENLDRNLRNAKLLTWVYTLAFLIWDKEMAIKRGPALQVAAMFSVCDLARYEMEVAQLIEDEEDELDADNQVAELADAVGVAGQANAEEDALKHLRQSVANQQGGREGEARRENRLEGGQATRPGTSVDSYHQYMGVTPVRHDGNGNGSHPQAF